MKKILIGVCVLAANVGVASAAIGHRPAAPTITASAEAAADSLYRLGRQAINDDNYEKAVSIFRQVVEKYPKSSSAGDALYWRAWAAYQLGRDRHNKD